MELLAVGLPDLAHFLAGSDPGHVGGDLLVELQGLGQVHQSGTTGADQTPIGVVRVRHGQTFVERQRLVQSGGVGACG